VFFIPSEFISILQVNYNQKEEEEEERKKERKKKDSRDSVFVKEVTHS
jgi:hypothetical protein